MIPGQVHRAVQLALLLLTSLPGCDQGADDDSSQDSLSYSQPWRSSTSPSGPTIELVINHSPLVTSMSSSTGILTAGSSLELQAVATDLDGDRLALRWTATCPGTFAHDDTTPVTYLPGALPPDGSACTFVVVVDDGHGGKATGMLTLSTVPPKLQLAGDSDEANALRHHLDGVIAEGDATAAVAQDGPEVDGPLGVEGPFVGH
jgi:hypothetical protein